MITDCTQTASTLQYKRSGEISQAMFLVLLQSICDQTEVGGMGPIEAVVRQQIIRSVPY